VWPRSAAFDAAIVQSHTVVIHAALWSPGMADVILSDLDVTGGSVTADRTATFRRSAQQVELVDRDGSLASLFSSRRTVPPVELVIERGIRYPGGATEMIPLGVLPVSAVTVSTNAAYNLACFDRSRRVSRNKFITPYTVPSGTRYADAAVAIVQDRLPFAVDVDISTTRPDTTQGPLIYLSQDDPWAAATAMASAIGCEMFFDQVGRLVIRDEPSTVSGITDFQYADGETSILLPESQQVISDDPGYNAVLVTGESSSNTTFVPRALVYDNDPSSPTYFFGPYGQVPEFFNDPTITDNNRAQVVAAGRLKRWLGRNDSLTLATVPHPAHDPSDVVSASLYGRDQLLTVQGVTIPLDVSTAGALNVRSQIPLA
jgi:hypothetical protein